MLRPLHAGYHAKQTYSRYSSRSQAPALIFTHKSRWTPGLCPVDLDADLDSTTNKEAQEIEQGVKQDNCPEGADHE